VSNLPIDKKELAAQSAEMHLITMAHLGEAQALIQQFDLKKTGLKQFEAAQLTLLLTGEGPWEAAIATATLLGQKKYHSVINLGIAGALQPELVIGEIYPVRSLYLAIEGRPQFKSMACADQGFDCLTSFERILTSEKAQSLRGVAAMVDREAWGVGMAARMNGIPFSSHKLISDLAGTLGACELVKAEAAEFSARLAQYLSELLPRELPAEAASFKLPGLHFTHSMELRFNDLLKKLSIRHELSPEEALARLPLNEFLQQKLQPKERSKLLLQYMEEELNPIKKVVQHKLQCWKAPLLAQGIEVHHHPELEDAAIQISFSIKDDQQLSQKILALNQFSLVEYQELLAGKIHVE
jgi:nucleoside phosphorylase